MTKLYVRWRTWLAAALDPDDGATAVEYALMIALIALVVLAAVVFMGQQTNSKFEDPELIAGLS